MTHSTIPVKKRRKIAAILFWLAVWQLAGMAVGQELLLASPLSVFLRLLELLGERPFWDTVVFSLLRIGSGFLLALAAGAACAALSARASLFRELLAPLVSVVKAAPVASFIILCLIWVDSKSLPVLISFLMVFPVVYLNILEGADHLDPKLSEMARVFRLPLGRRLLYLYLPQLLPYFRSACSIGLGLAWKAGVSAEVIGIPTGSVGERLYQAKLFLSTADLFAWTIVIIALSALSERLFLALTGWAARRLERM